MSENLKLSEEEIGEGGENKKVYPNIAEYLSAFEASPEFKTALDERRRHLETDRNGLEITDENLLLGMRSVKEYRYAMEKFFRAGNWLEKDLTKYPEEAQLAIREYWQYVSKLPHHTDMIRLTAKDREDEVNKHRRASWERDRYHTAAGLALMGKGVTLADGRRIACKEFEQDNEDALILTDYTVLGRSLVSIISEENGMDKFDSSREEKKKEEVAEYLYSSRFKDGHYVGLGEK